MAEQFFIHNPIPIKYGFLNRAQHDNQKIIDYFLDLRKNNKVVSEQG